LIHLAVRISSRYIDDGDHDCGINHDKHHEYSQEERIKMKVTRQQVAKNRQRILEVAGKLFREKGFDGVSVADIMKSAGLTHGAFYGHFASKHELAAQACANAVAKALDVWTAWASDKSPDQLGAIVANYLTPSHRDDLGGGCVLAALGADVVRQPGCVRRAFTDGIRSTVAMLSMIARGPSNAAQREKALTTLAGLVGALTLARAADDRSLSDEILSAALATLGGRSSAMNPPIQTRLRGTNHKKIKGRQTATPPLRN
jgi:TetR/AcrR family transcriptional repressor of nem operon